MSSSWQQLLPPLGGFGASLEEELLTELDRSAAEERRTNKKTTKNEKPREKGSDTKNEEEDEEEEEEEEEGEEYEQDATECKETQQPWKYLCILDFEAVREGERREEWLFEITEFPVVLLNCKTLQVEDIFHRWGRPARISPGVWERYTRKKYGPIGLAEDALEKAVGLAEMLNDLEQWLRDKNLLPPADGEDGDQFDFAFVTCGDWDLKYMLPRNCQLLSIPVPKYMKKWSNIKRVYQQFYGRKRPPTGMVTMLRALNIPLEGTHHVGKDDATNIAKIACRLMKEGCVFSFTGQRDEADANRKLS